jgi:hypothetical protein
VRRSTTLVATGLLVVALLLAGVVSRFASSDPDGLTKVSEDKGFAGTEVTHHSGLFDYGSLSGVIGVLVVLALAGLVTVALRRRGHDHEDSQA